MNRREENRGSMQLVPSPDIGTGHMENPFRRLIAFDLTCPLCGEHHQASFYYTEEAATLDEFMAGLHAMAQDWSTMQPVLSKAVLEIHEWAGDLDRMLEGVALGGTPGTEPPTYRIIDERLYTCDDCGAEFQAMRELREHIPEAHG